MKVQKKIKVSLSGSDLQTPVKVVAADTAIQLVLEYIDFNIPSGTTATLFVMKPSKKFVYQTEDIIVDGNTVTINVKNQAIIERGEAHFTVTLTNGDDKVSTFSNYFDVDRNYSSLEAEESKTIIGDLISEEMIEDYINAYLTENPAITDEQLGNAISAYFAKNPITGGSVSADQIAQAVEDYLTEHPVSGGATAEQAEQIEKNRQDISKLSATVNDHKDNTDIHVTAEEKQVWNNKSDFSGDYNDLKNKPTIPEGADLTGYATENFVKEYAQPKGEYLTPSNLSNAVNTALTQAKESGEFKGDKGDSFTYEDFTEEQLASLKGDTPVKGTDYFTEADKSELVTDVIEALPTWTGGSY